LAHPADFTMAASRGYYANDYVGCGIAYAEQRPPSASVVIGNWTNSPDDSSTEWITASFSLRRGN
jgi:predicted lysophospholipase L1 biosynthesis ABC-type transport system permease subunit